LILIGDDVGYITAFDNLTLKIDFQVEVH